jgi:hypothetical protein
MLDAINHFASSIFNISMEQRWRRCGVRVYFLKDSSIDGLRKLFYFDMFWFEINFVNG